MEKEKDLTVNDWIALGFRSALVMVIGVSVFYFNQNNASLKESLTMLDKTLRALQEHITETDKVVAEIKVSREIYMPKFLAMIESQDEIRRKTESTNGRLTAIEESLNRHKIH